MQPKIPSHPSPGFRPRLLVLSVAACFSVPAAIANPTGGTVVSGSATFAASGNSLTINNSANAIINWQSFSIGAGEITKFIQSSSASAVLNRVIGSGGVIPQSIINGILSSNGQVFLLNPSGVVIGANAFIDVAGLVTSSLNMSNEDFLAGRMRFTEVPGAGRVKNEGTIETPLGGRVYLIAPDVENSGVIRSPDGQIVLAAGKSVELAAENTPFVTVKITADNEQALNVGSLVAKGGSINMHGALVKQSGVMEAGSAVVGANGEIRLVASKDLTLATGSKTSASGAAGGKILLQAQTGTNKIQGTVEATGASGKGGVVQALGVRVGVLGNGIIDASGETGGGTVQVGGDYKGRNADVQNAQSTEIGTDGVIRADARNTGDGGRVIIWADGDTQAAGTISVRGGAEGGNGGFVETSGKQTLNISGARVSMGASKGKGGLWLLDPADYYLDAPAASSINAAMYGGGSTLIEAAENINFLTNLDIAEQGSGTFSAYAGNNIDMGVHNVTTNGQSVVMEANSGLIYGVTPSGTGSITHAIGGGTFMTRGGSVSLSGVDVSVGSIDTMGVGSGMSGGAVNVAAYGGSITVNGFIQTQGTNGDWSNDQFNPGQRGGDGGNITLHASSPTSQITVYGGLYASGGNGGGGYGATPINFSTAGGDGGNGGNIDITPGQSLNIQGNIVSRGGQGGRGGNGADTYYGGSSGGNGGQGGNFNIFDVNSFLTQIALNDTLDVSGGSGGWGGDLGGTGGYGGYGGLVNITGGSINTRYVYSIGGDGGEGGYGGTSTFSAGNGGDAGYGGSVWMSAPSGSITIGGTIEVPGGRGGKGGYSQGYADGGEGGWGGGVQSQYDSSYGDLAVRLEAGNSISVDGINFRGGRGGFGGSSPGSVASGSGGNGGAAGRILALANNVHFYGDVLAGGGDGQDAGYASGTNSIGSGGTGGTGGEILVYGGSTLFVDGITQASGGDGGEGAFTSSALAGRGGSIAFYGGNVVTGSVEARSGRSEYAEQGGIGGRVYISGSSVDVNGGIDTSGGSDNSYRNDVIVVATNGWVTVDGSINTSASTSRGYGGEVGLSAYYGIYVGGSIDTRGSDGMDISQPYGSPPVLDGSKGGNISLTRTGTFSLSDDHAVEVTGNLVTRGGGGLDGAGYYGAGGAGGEIVITGPSKSLLHGSVHLSGTDIDTSGGKGADQLDSTVGSMGGLAGNLDIKSYDGVQILASIHATGGAGGRGGDAYFGSGGDGGSGGNGGSIVISGSSVSFDSIHANGGAGGNGGAGNGEYGGGIGGIGGMGSQIQVYGGSMIAATGMMQVNGGDAGDGAATTSALAGSGGSIAFYGGHVSTGSIEARSGSTLNSEHGGIGGNVYISGHSVEVNGGIDTFGGSNNSYRNDVTLAASDGWISVNGSINTSASTSRSYGGDVSLTAFYGIYVGGTIDTRGANGMGTQQPYFAGTRGGSINLSRSGTFELSETHAVEVMGNLLTRGGDGLDGSGYYGYGLGGQGGNVSISGPGETELYGSVRIGGTVIDTAGGRGASHFNSEGGANGGNAGSVSVAANGNVEVLAAIQANGGSGGRGGNSSGLVPGGHGGSGGHGGNVALLGSMVSFNGIHADGGAGGDGGAGTLAYAGGTGGMGGMGGQIGLFNSGSNTFSFGDVFAEGGAGGMGGANSYGGLFGSIGNGGSAQSIYAIANGAISIDGAILVRGGLNGNGTERTSGGGLSLIASGGITQGAQAIAANHLDIVQHGSSGDVTLTHAGNDFQFIYADGGEGAPIQGAVSIVTSNPEPEVDWINARDAIFLKNSRAGGGFYLNEVASETSGVTVVADNVAQVIISADSVHAEDPVNGYFQYYTTSDTAMTIDHTFFTDVHAPKVILGSDSTTASITLTGLGVLPTTPNELRAISTRTSGAVSVGTIYMNSASPTLPVLLDLQGGSISQSGYLDVDHLMAHASSGNVDLTHAGNRISAIDSGSAAGSFTVNSALALNPSANNIQAGGDITLTNSIAYAGNAWNLGNIMSDSGSVNVVADSLGVAYGASAMNIHAATAFNWRTANNAAMGVNQAFFDGINAPAIRLGGSGQSAPIVLTGPVDLGSTDTLSLYSTGDVYQTAGATLTATNFSAHGANVLFPLVNNVQNFHGRAAAGELNFVNGTSLKLTSIDPAIPIPGASAADIVSLLADGDITTDIVGSYAIRAPEVGLLATGTIGSVTTPLQIQAEFLGSVSSTSAYLTTNQFDPAMVTIGDFVNDDVGHIVLNAYGGATTTTLVDNPGGNIEIKTFSPLNVLAGMNAGGNILLATSGSGNNNIQLNGTFTYGGTSFSATPGTGGLAVQGTGYTVVALAPTTTTTGEQQVQNLVKTDSSFKQALDLTTTETAKTTEATTSTTPLKDDAPTAADKKKEEEDKDKKGTKVGVAVCK